MSRIFPSRSDYQAIIHHLDKFAGQPSLKKAKVQMQANGSFTQVYSGGRAVVFPIHENGSKYALKCWVQSLGDLAIRYQQINSFVNQNKPSYMLDSSYLDDELLVNGTRYPVLKMPWANSLTLKEWINVNISNSSALNALAESFLKLCREMHALSFSHGDLQHDNILVGNKGNLVLVDYDSAYIPGLEHLRDEIKGLPGFQHNSRAKLEFCNPCADYFSEYVIYLSLFGLAKNPRLWDGAKGHNRLLFSEGDIRNPGSSIIVQELRSIPELSKVLDAYLDNCKFDSLEKMIPLDQIMGISGNHVILPNPKHKSSKTTTSANPQNFTGSRFDNFKTWSPTSSQNSTTEWDFGQPAQNIIPGRNLSNKINVAPFGDSKLTSVSDGSEFRNLARPKGCFSFFIFTTFLFFVSVLIFLSHRSPVPTSGSPVKVLPDADASGASNAVSSDQSSVSAESTCGPGGPWLVLGPPEEELRLRLRRDFCADAFINSSGELQVARFDDNSKAQAFLEKISKLTGQSYSIRDSRLESSDDSSSAPESSRLAENKEASDASGSRSSDGVQDTETSSSSVERKCTLLGFSGNPSEELGCSLRSRVNSNGNTVYDISWSDGDQSTYVFWRSGNVEIISKSSAYSSGLGKYEVDNSNVVISTESDRRIIIPNFTVNYN